MIARERLKRGGLRAYESGRLRFAARAAWVVVPAALFCALETGAGEQCACIGVLLLGASVFLRWRDRRGVDAVRDGLLAGALPLLAGLFMARVAPTCAADSLLSCATICGVSLPSGLWLALRWARNTAPSWSRVAAMGVAMSAASLGCAAVGVGGLAGAAIGLGVGAASGWLLGRR